MNSPKKFCFRKLFDGYVSTLFNKIEKFVLNWVDGDEELANKIILKAYTNYETNHWEEEGFLFCSLSFIGQSPIKKIRYVDLCCGIGGFRVGMNEFQKQYPEYQFECVFSADIKKGAIENI